jgi:ferredoxin
MTLRAQIDDAGCIGQGDCVDIAPGVFILEHDIAELAAPGTDEQLRQAARACPTGAILLFDRDTGEEVDP